MRFEGFELFKGFVNLSEKRMAFEFVMFHSSDLTIHLQLFFIFIPYFSSI